jgi:hypothetical protein
VRYATAFRDGAAGQVPEGWSLRWNMVEDIGNSPFDVSPVVHQTFLDEEPVALVRTDFNSATGYGVMTLDAVDADPDRADVDVLVLVSVALGLPVTIAQQPVIAVRQSGSAGSETPTWRS